MPPGRPPALNLLCCVCFAALVVTLAVPRQSPLRAPYALIVARGPRHILRVARSQRHSAHTSARPLALITFFTTHYLFDYVCSYRLRHYRRISPTWTCQGTQKGASCCPPCRVSTAKPPSPDMEEVGYQRLPMCCCGLTELTDLSACCAVLIVPPGWVFTRQPLSRLAETAAWYACYGPPNSVTAHG